MKRVTFNITTDASGDYDSTDDATTVSGQIRVEGPYILHAIRWIVDELDAGVDFVLSAIDDLNGDAVLLDVDNADAEAWYHPGRLIVGSTGTAATDAYSPMVVDGPLELVVANGGNAQSGKMIVYLLEV